MMIMRKSILVLCLGLAALGALMWAMRGADFQTLNLGTAPNDHTGDTLRVGGAKLNSNFALAVNKSGDTATNLTVTNLTVVGSAATMNGAPFLTNAVVVNGTNVTVPSLNDSVTVTWSLS